MSDKGVVQATVATSSHANPHNKRPTFIYPTGKCSAFYTITPTSANIDVSERFTANKILQIINCNASPQKIGACTYV